MKSELFRKKNCVADCFIKICSNFLIGVHGVAVAGKSTDFNIVFFEKSLEFFKLCIVCKKLFGICVGIAGEAAAADFNHLDAE